MGQDFPPSQLSLYLHIPFCLTRCGYCSFFSLPYDRKDVENYVTCLIKELELHSTILRQPLHSLYFGGGTPSLMSPQQINTLISHVQLTPDAEITLEINPLQITQAYLEGLTTTPVNRLSIGLQSMHADELKWLQRRHQPSEIAGKIQLCRSSGYHNLSLDLIYGLPRELTGTGSQALARLKANLDQYIDLSPDHISCYLLTLDDNCKLLQDKSPSFTLPSDELAARMYHLIRRTLIKAGFQHYEISNFARPGRESKHNLVYWQGGAYLAAGASAAGFIPPMRYQHPSDLQAYYANIGNRIQFPDPQAISPEQQQKDALMLGLRLIKGIDIDKFNRLYHCDLMQAYGTRIAKLRHLGMLKIQKGYLALSSKALFVSNAVIGELLS